MKNYIIRRILQMIPVFIGIIFILFILLEMSPGTPVSHMMNPKMTPEQREELLEKMGFNKPWYERFVTWFKEAAKGNLGQSIKHKKPVTEVIKDYIGPTLLLSFLSLMFAVLIGIPIGILSATKQYSFADNALTVFSLIGISLPAFFFALLLLKYFAVDMKIFPLFGMQDAMIPKNADTFKKFIDITWHMILPTLVLGLSQAATFMRYTRSSMLEVIRQDYIRTARSKGLKEKVVIYKHALRNAMIPIVTLLAFSIPGLLSGAVMTETIFSLPGLGKTSVDATMTKNIPLILGINAMSSMLVLLSTLIGDIMYAVVDPRVRYD
jgi:peptide/nickel transport system permease protein